jgi:hypothetical protein
MGFDEKILRKRLKNTFLGPILAVIAFNMFIIITLIKKVIKIYAKKGLNTKKRSKLRQFFFFSLLAINLGITWILFLLYINKWSPYFSIFSYVFIVLNGLQVRYILFSN